MRLIILGRYYCISRSWMDLNRSIGESLGKHYSIYFNLLRNKEVGYFVMVSEPYPYTHNILNHGWRIQWWQPSMENYLTLRHNHFWQSWSLDYAGTIEGQKLWWMSSFNKNNFEGDEEIWLYWWVNQEADR